MVRVKNIPVRIKEANKPPTGQSLHEFETKNSSNFSDDEPKTPPTSRHASSNNLNLSKLTLTTDDDRVSVKDSNDERSLLSFLKKSSIDNLLLEIESARKINRVKVISTFCLFVCSESMKKK
jgi:hypothetical protein